MYRPNYREDLGGVNSKTGTYVIDGGSPPKNYLVPLKSDNVVRYTLFDYKYVALVIVLKVPSVCLVQ